MFDKNDYEVDTEEGVYDVDIDPYEAEQKRILKEKQEKSLMIKKIMIIGGAIFIGLFVFLITQALFGKKTVVVQPPKKTELSLTDSRVTKLYPYVTYGLNNTRNTKFISNKSVKLNDFTNYEKFLYALQFASATDFKETGKTETDYNLKVYALANDKVLEYMKKFFGDNVKYSKKGNIPYTFPFKVETGNTASLEYNEERDAFLTTFGNTNTESVATTLVNPYYTKLASAYVDTNTDIVLQENVIYTTLTQYKDENGNPKDQYDLKVYQDYSHTILLDERLGVTAADITTTPVDIETYVYEANTVTYRFKKSSNGNYYFYSSSIEY